MLAVADLARVGESAARPVDLWRLAEKETAAVVSGCPHVADRLIHFRHGMIHAGFVNEPGKPSAPKLPYDVCPICDEALPR